MATGNLPRYDQAELERELSERENECVRFLKAESFAIKGKILLECSDHGEFNSTVGAVFGRKWICQKCWYEYMPKRFVTVVKRPKSPKPLDAFLSRITLPEHISLETSDFRGMTRGKIVVNCDLHGETTYGCAAEVRQRKYLCGTCGKDYAHPKITTWEKFLALSREKFGERFSYALPAGDSWTGLQSKVFVNCGVHEPKAVTAGAHLSKGVFCVKCRLHESKLLGLFPGGYATSGFFEKNPELATTQAHIYYVKVGSLYKIGVTKRALSDRFGELRKSSKKSLEILDTLSVNLEDAVALEQYILDKYATHRTIRNWSTELFSQDVLRGSDLISKRNQLIKDGWTLEDLHLKKRLALIAKKPGGINHRAF